MASSSKQQNTETVNDGAINTTDEVVVDKQAEKALEDFYAKKLSPGTAIRFVTRGGQTVPVVRKV